MNIHDKLALQLDAALPVLSHLYWSNDPSAGTVDAHFGEPTFVDGMNEFEVPIGLNAVVNKIVFQSKYVGKIACCEAGEPFVGLERWCESTRSTFPLTELDAISAVYQLNILSRLTGL